jgi:hypothetical protein
MVSSDGAKVSDDPRPGPEDLWARRTALAVALLGLIVVIVPALLHVGRVLADDPFAAPTRKVIVVREGDGKKETETTISPDDRSMLDRGLSSGGLLLLRLGVVAVAAFLAGATVQRIIARDFSGKFGPLELQKVSRAAVASSVTVRDLTQALQTQKALAQQTGELASRTARQTARLSSRTAEELEELRGLTQEAAALATRTAKQLEDLKAQVDGPPSS